MKTILFLFSMLFTSNFLFAKDPVDTLSQSWIHKRCSDSTYQKIQLRYVSQSTIFPFSKDKVDYVVFDNLIESFEQLTSKRDSLASKLDSVRYKFYEPSILYKGQIYEIAIVKKRTFDLDGKDLVCYSFYISYPNRSINEHQKWHGVYIKNIGFVCIFDSYAYDPFDIEVYRLTDQGNKNKAELAKIYSVISREYIPVHCKNSN